MWGYLGAHVSHDLVLAVSLQTNQMAAYSLHAMLLTPL